MEYFQNTKVFGGFGFTFGTVISIFTQLSESWSDIYF